MSNIKLPLFILNDQGTCDFSDIAKMLYNKSKQYLVINGNSFCNSAFDTAYLRNEWLKVCFEISEKIGLPIVINASLTPDNLEKSENAKLFSHIYYISTVSSNERFNQRYDELNIQNSDWRKSAKLSNEYLQAYAKTEYPEMKLINIGESSLCEIANLIDEYILECINNERFNC